MSRGGTAGAVLACSLSIACGGAAVHVAALDDMDRVRGSAGAQEGATLAPEAYARAEQERDIARGAHAAGDEVAAGLHAERAVAAYGHAVVVARLARAMSELADAQKSLEDATAQEEVLEASRAKLERNADELEERLRGARERVLPAASAPATPEREAARLVAARSLATQARLICAAARLIAPEAAGLASADDEVTRLEDRLAKSPRPAPIDDAARARTRCLDVLTLTRRGTGDDGGATDALLAELSAAGGWEPSRDERGVTVTLHDAFRAADLSGAVADRLKELGRVAAAHPHFAVQLVVHDASAPVSGDTADAKRAEAAVQALVGGGAVSSRVRAELAGASAPIVDPANANGRARNERLEVVFVGNGR